MQCITLDVVCLSLLAEVTRSQERKVGEPAADGEYEGRRCEQNKQINHPVRAQNARNGGHQEQRSPKMTAKTQKTASGIRNTPGGGVLYPGP